MTTMTMSDPASDATAPSQRDRRIEGRLTFDGMLRGEWMKLFSLRSIRWSIVVMLLLSWAGAGLIAVSMGDPSTMATTSLVAQSATFGSTLTVLVIGVLGVLAMTNEYSSGMILSTLCAVPRRGRLFTAKALVVAALALVVGALGTFGGGLVAASVLGGDGFAAFVDPAVLLSMLGTTLYLVLAALLAFGIGTMLRSSAAAISAVVTLLFVATLVFQILTMTGWEWVPAVAEWLPANLGNEIATAAMVPAGTPDEFLGVGYWAALAGLAAWAAAALVPAAILFTTRDAV